MGIAGGKVQRARRAVQTRGLGWRGDGCHLLTVRVVDWRARLGMERSSSFKHGTAEGELEVFLFLVCILHVGRLDERDSMYPLSCFARNFSVLYRVSFTRCVLAAGMGRDMTAHTFSCWEVGCSGLYTTIVSEGGGGGRWRKVEGRVK